ncbi:MAG: hypothetical protein M1496_01910 [Candidatus Thermoplasmatota archaeon]|jgi:hypothetical protein|nr:hypothetical protein [Candidatus Thermoplasmatota archaeon]
MRHASIEDLKNLEDLLDNIRKIRNIREKTPGHFYFKGKGILHFHTDFGKLYADLYDMRIDMGSMEHPSEEMKRYLILLIEEYSIE